MLKNNFNITAEELWRKITTINTTRASYDTTKFIALIAFFTGCSEKYVSRKLYEGFTLTERHKPYIDRINQLFSVFNLPISLKVGTSY